MTCFWLKTWSGAAPRLESSPQGSSQHCYRNSLQIHRLSNSVSAQRCPTVLVAGLKPTMQHVPAAASHRVVELPVRYTFGFYWAAMLLQEPLGILFNHPWNICKHCQIKHSSMVELSALKPKVLRFELLNLLKSWRKKFHLKYWLMSLMVWLSVKQLPVFLCKNNFRFTKTKNLLWAYACLLRSKSEFNWTDSR